jgi:transcriptional regulator NrdR family protein
VNSCPLKQQEMGRRRKKRSLKAFNVNSLVQKVVVQTQTQQEVPTYEIGNMFIEKVISTDKNTVNLDDWLTVHRSIT